MALQKSVFLKQPNVSHMYLCHEGVDTPWESPVPGLPSSRIPAVWGDPFRKCPRHPLSEAPAPVKNSGKSPIKPKCGRRLRRRPHFGLPSDLSEGVSRILHRGWCLAEGMGPGSFPEGTPQTPGIREEGSPGIGDSQGVSTPSEFVLPSACQ